MLSLHRTMIELYMENDLICLESLIINLEDLEKLNSLLFFFSCLFKWHSFLRQTLFVSTVCHPEFIFVVF